MIINSSHRFGVLDTAAGGPLQKTQHESEDNEHTQSCGGAEVAQCENRYDLESVATHEVGHFLGLGEDESDKCATMYRSTGRCEVNKRVLSPDDQASMSGLYAAGFADNSGASTGCSVADAPARAPRAPLGAALGLMVVLGAALRRR